MVIVLVGEDSWRRHERVQTLQRAFHDKFDALGLSTATLTTETVSSDLIRTSLLSAGLFTQKRFVAMLDVLSWSEALQAVVIETVSHLGEDSIVVVSITAWPKTVNPLATWLKAQAKLEEYPVLTEQQLRQWIQQRVTAAGATIASPAVLWLLQAVGTDLWSLHNVLQQLCHYTKTIDLVAVQQFVPSVLDDNIFHLTDALATGQTAVALRLMHEQLQGGASPFYLLTMLARQVTIMVRVKETGGTDTELHPYVMKKILPRVQHIGLDKLRALSGRLLDIDRISKTTGLDPVVQLDQFVVIATQ